MKHRRSILLAATAVACMIGGQIASAGETVLMTGGSKGDYYLVFGPPVRALLSKAWVDAPIVESDGTPASMDRLLTSQDSYALGQGNVVADLMRDPKYAGHIKTLPAASIGSEVVVAVMDDATYQRSQGSWAAVAAHARQVRFVTSSAASGPGRTFQELQTLDPNGLGKAAAGSVTFEPNMDIALNDVSEGKANVALMVQFPNPSNPRFKFISDRKLHVVPVISGAMRGLKMPDGTSAFTLCSGAEVGGGVTVTTACSPIVLLTGAANDNPDLDKVFHSVTEDDFKPQESSFARLWKGLRRQGSAAWDTATSAADAAAAKLADKM